MALIKNRSKKSIALIAAAGLTVAGTGVAFAYWTSTGSGSGRATTGQASPFIVTSEPPTGSALFPGGPVQNVVVLVSHANSASQQLSTLTARVANPDGTPWAITGCSAADYLVSVAFSGPVQVETRQTRSYTTTISMVETGQNQNGCQTVTVPLYFTAA